MVLYPADRSDFRSRVEASSAGGVRGVTSIHNLRTTTAMARRSCGRQADVFLGHKSETAAKMIGGRDTHPPEGRNPRASRREPRNTTASPAAEAHPAAATGVPRRRWANGRTDDELRGFGRGSTDRRRGGDVRRERSETRGSRECALCPRLDGGSSAGHWRRAAEARPWVTHAHGQRARPAITSRAASFAHHSHNGAWSCRGANRSGAAVFTGISMTVRPCAIPDTLSRYGILPKGDT